MDASLSSSPRMRSWEVPLSAQYSTLVSVTSTHCSSIGAQSCQSRRSSHRMILLGRAVGSTRTAEATRQCILNQYTYTYVFIYSRFGFKLKELYTVVNGASHPAEAPFSVPSPPRKFDPQLQEERCRAEHFSPPSSDLTPYPMLTA